MKILVFPREPNPYQELLYTQVRAAGVEVVYLEGPTGSHTVNLLLLPLVLFVRRMQGYDVFHVHWLFKFSLPFGGVFGRLLSEWYFVLVTLWIKLLGYKIIWTAHNAMPHERQFMHDAFAQRFLIRLSSRVIVHSSAITAQLRELGFKTAKVTVIPHGNYADVYPNTTSRARARTRLRIPSRALVFLFFGAIRRYKGVDNLLAAFELFCKDLPQNKRPYVLLAGGCKDETIRADINAAQKRLGGHLLWYDEFIPDEEVQYYFHAADAMVLPFQQISTSGSAILGLTFGLPLIAPRLGGLEDMPKTVGKLYDVAASNALTEAMQYAYDHPEKLKAMQVAAARYGATLDWTHIAADYLKLLRSL